MKRRMLCVDPVSMKRQRYEPVLGKRHRDTTVQNSSKRPRLPPGVLGKHQLEQSNLPTPKKPRHTESESLRNFLVSAHTTIEFQKQHIFALKQKIKELAYILSVNNEMKNPTYNHTIECY